MTYDKGTQRRHTQLGQRAQERLLGTLFLGERMHELMPVEELCSLVSWLRGPQTSWNSLEELLEGQPLRSVQGLADRDPGSAQPRRRLVPASPRHLLLLLSWSHLVQGLLPLG